jgi:hypothetical protein
MITAAILMELRTAELRISTQGEVAYGRRVPTDR